jgi:hypothetical protein
LTGRWQAPAAVVEITFGDDGRSLVALVRRELLASATTAALSPAVPAVVRTPATTKPPMPKQAERTSPTMANARSLGPSPETSAVKGNTEL